MQYQFYICQLYEAVRVQLEVTQPQLLQTAFNVTCAANLKHKGSTVSNQLQKTYQLMELSELPCIFLHVKMLDIHRCTDLPACVIRSQVQYCKHKIAQYSRSTTPGCIVHIDVIF